jgi:hypothetical protein
MATGSRGCGYRIRGAVYLETKLGPFGKPIEDFLIDSPQVIDPNALGMRPRGMTPLLREDATHLLDWVGAEGYPNVTDFIEEARRKGISRRVLPSLLGDLTPESRLLLVHPRASVRNAVEFWQALANGARAGYPTVPCPSAIRGDMNHPNMVGPALKLDTLPDEWTIPQPWCLGCCWHDVIGKQDGEQVLATVGDVTYHAWPRPEVTSAVEYQPALFAAFPITSIAVVRDPDDADRVNKLFAQVNDLLNGIPAFLEDA